jgi:hypothetical protein
MELRGNVFALSSVDLDDRLVDPEGRKRREELRTPKPQQYRPPEWDPRRTLHPHIPA